MADDAIVTLTHPELQLSKFPSSHKSRTFFTFVVITITTYNGGTTTLPPLSTNQLVKTQSLKGPMSVRDFDSQFCMRYFYCATLTKRAFGSRKSNLARKISCLICIYAHTCPERSYLLTWYDAVQTCDYLHAIPIDIARCQEIIRMQQDFNLLHSHFQ